MSERIWIEGSKNRPLGFVYRTAGGIVRAWRRDGIGVPFKTNLEAICWLIAIDEAAAFAAEVK